MGFNAVFLKAELKVLKALMKRETLPLMSVKIALVIQEKELRVQKQSIIC